MRSKNERGQSEHRPPKPTGPNTSSSPHRQINTKMPWWVQLRPAQLVLVFFSSATWDWGFPTTRALTTARKFLLHRTTSSTSKNTSPSCDHLSGTKRAICEEASQSFSLQCQAACDQDIGAAFATPISAVNCHDECLRALKAALDDAAPWTEAKNATLHYMENALQPRYEKLEGQFTLNREQANWDKKMLAIEEDSELFWKLVCADTSKWKPLVCGGGRNQTVVNGTGNATAIAKPVAMKATTRAADKAGFLALK
ncbi:unnamed protein product [Amoebophrya sp. A120]|nr:unnamed protein product [Amoebophrya sp. A120]|eukprot:GSA120T00023143001.1